MTTEVSKQTKTNAKYKFYDEEFGERQYRKAMKWDDNNYDILAKKKNDNDIFFHVKIVWNQIIS